MKATALIGLNYNGIEVLEVSEKLSNGAYLFKIKVDTENGEEFIFKRKFEILNLINQNKYLTSQQKKKIGSSIADLGIIISFENNKYVVYDGKKVLIQSKQQLEKKIIVVKQKKAEIAQNAKLLTVDNIKVGQVITQDKVKGTIVGFSQELNIIKVKYDFNNRTVIYGLTKFIKEFNKKIQATMKKKNRKSVNASTEGRLKQIFTALVNACINEKFASYQTIGAKGISISSDLDTYEKFKEWAISQNFKVGQKIVRKDTSKDFSKTNCSFK